MNRKPIIGFLLFLGLGTLYSLTPHGPGPVSDGLTPVWANKIENVLAYFHLEIVGSGIVATAAEPASEYPQNPCSWMHDGNPRLEEIKQIQERLSEHLRGQLKPYEEFVSLGSRCDDQGEPYFKAGINPDRIEVVQEKGLPEVWEGIPVKYVPMKLYKMIK